jgi:hypothetical protein
MFVQVIRGKTKDPAGARALGDKWDKELRPGATGFLGVTAGTTENNEMFTAVRFESAEAAQKNNDRPEQGQFAQEMGALMEGEPQFFNCPTVHLFNGGGNDAATFVQAMVYKTKDLDGLLGLTKEFEKMSDSRPDLLGGMMCVAEDGKTIFDINYFTSEAEARAAESQEMPAEMQQAMAKFGELIDGEVEFIDIRDPDLR